MKPPTQILDDADLLAYAAVPASARFTGRLHLYQGGERVGPVPFLAICRPHNEPGLLLAHCDESWDIVGLQAWNGPGVEPILTIEEMKTQAEVFYEGLMESWQLVTVGDLDVIAERQLVLRKDDSHIDVTVKIGKPELDESGANWKCPYEIWFGNACRAMAMHGADSMQALQLTIATLDVELEIGIKRFGGTLYHYDEPFNSILENSGLRLKAVMDSNTLNEFATRYTAAWCSQHAASVASFFEELGSLKINDGTPAVGRAAITNSAQSFMTAFPDIVVKMDRLVVKRAKTEYHWTLTGTNTGPGGTGKFVKISGLEEWRFGPDGLIAESLGHFDAADYERQLNAGGQRP